MTVDVDGLLVNPTPTVTVYDIPPHTNGIGVGGVNGDTRLSSGTITGGAYVDGFINTLAIFPKALTQNEVTFYQSNGFGEFFPTLFVTSQGAGMAFARSGDFSDYYINSSSGFFGLRLNQWNHITLTYDKATQTARLYHNGVQVSQASVPLSTRSAR